MNLRQLQYFVVLAEELHFRRASERLNLAQPALSRQLQELESELAVKLLWRDRRHVELTSAGRVLLERARRVLAEVEYAVLATKQSASKLAIGYVPSTSYVVVPAILKEFRLQAPNVDLDMQGLVTVLQFEALLRRRVDVGIVRPWPLPDGIAYRPLLTESFVVAVPSNHPQNGQEAVPLSVFRDERFIMHGGQFGMAAFSLHDMMMRMFRRAGFAPQVARETPTEMHTALGMVSAGFGVALAPSSMIRAPTPGVGFVTVHEAGPDSEIGLAWRRDNHNELCETFVGAAARAVISFESQFRNS